MECFDFEKGNLLCNLLAAFCKQKKCPVKMRELSMPQCPFKDLECKQITKEDWLSIIFPVHKR